jgi:hypothetical protein
MGAYSSWPVFALTHGLLIGYLNRHSQARDVPFRVLGDDVVIYDDDLAVKYQKALAELDVPIS